MSLPRLALAYLLDRAWLTAASVAGIGLGLCLILLVLHVRQGSRDFLAAQVSTVDLVVGPPGSDVALVLSSLLYADEAQGTLPVAELDWLRTLPGVRAAYPLCQGDLAGGHRIVGTDAALLTDRVLAGRRPQGRLPTADFEIAAGAQAAIDLGLHPGDRVVSTHGADAAAEHGDHPYTVVGILPPTGRPHDRVLFTTVGSYWQVHAAPASDPLLGRGAGGPAVSSVLVDATERGLFAVQQQVRERGLRAVRPAVVSQRLFEKVLAPVEGLLLLYGLAVCAVAGLGVLCLTCLTVAQRAADLRLLRAMGASRRELATVVVAECGIQLFVGGAAALVASRLALAALDASMVRTYGVPAAAGFTPAELGTVVAAVALGSLAAVVPAWAVTRGELG